MKPQKGDFCKVLYDNRDVTARVTGVNDGSFDVETSFGEPMYNIPLDKYRREFDLGCQIVNMINEKYNLDLMTIDSAEMSNDINDMLREKYWMIHPY
jgi:hypothetical protein